MGMPLPLPTVLCCICYVESEGYPGFCSGTGDVCIASGIGIKKFLGRGYPKRGVT